MISFRYHIVSIVAVFLALALGIVVSPRNHEAPRPYSTSVSGPRTSVSLRGSSSGRASGRKKRRSP